MKAGKRAKVSAAVARAENLFLPLAGTIRWSPRGKPLGIWGKDFRLRLFIKEAGRMRQATPAEERMARAIHPEIRRMFEVAGQIWLESRARNGS